MVRVILLITVAVLVAAPEMASASSTERNMQNCKSLTNGCSNYGLLQEYESYFTPACNVHDICYNCGTMFSVSRTRCDSVFFTDMLKGCMKIIAEWDKCFRDATAYYTVVRFFGSAFYMKKSHTHCKKECARKIMQQM